MGSIMQDSFLAFFGVMLEMTGDRATTNVELSSGLPHAGERTHRRCHRQRRSDSLECPVRLAAAMILIVDTELEPEDFTHVLRRLFSLTAAEARVAACVLHTDGLQSVAEELCISLSTVRIHLQRVFAKTTTHRQAELVRLLLDVQASTCRLLIWYIADLQPTLDSSIPVGRDGGGIGLD